MRLIITLIVMISSQTLIAQKHKPIDQVGWELPDELSQLIPEEEGSLEYLLTVSDEGEIKRIRVLNNTFDAKLEQAFRFQLKTLTLPRKESNDKAGRKGTLQISSGPCSKVETKSCEVKP